MSVERARELIEKRDGRPFRESEPMERPTEAIKRYQALVEGAEDGQSDLVRVVAYMADREAEVARLREEKQELLDVALGAYRSAGVWGKPVIGAAILRASGPPWKW